MQKLEDNSSSWNILYTGIVMNAVEGASASIRQWCTKREVSTHSGAVSNDKLCPKRLALPGHFVRLIPLSALVH